MEKLFQDRKALVIGGSGGIGAAVSENLARMGAAHVVVLGGSSVDRLEQTASKVRQAGARVQTELWPVTSVASAQAIAAKWPEMDVVVCAWGPFTQAGLAETSAEMWERLALCNLAFPGAIVSCYIKTMAEKGYGRFLFFGGTTTDSIQGYTTTAAYSAAKTGLGVLAKSVAKEYAGTGVTALAVCPGFVDTGYLSEAVRENWRQSAPGGRLADPQQLARSALVLLAEELASGAIVSLDGGLDLKKRRK